MTTSPEEPRKGSLWRTARAIGWSFFGVRKNSAFQDDIAKLNPLHIIAVGLVAVAILVVALILVVRWVATA
ncbi:DUF2970 domain-containing protein [Variovorax ureilyticus]|uniref:DUF2970 domain-containing protein n=1 Tax=Variovorax ureilyticus TaxID=1836198 RepID=A0ABU8VN97_9BURK